MAMKIVRFNCCGMDVHKNLVVATIGITDRKTNVTEYFQRSFSTLNSDLYRLKDWLRSHHCSDVCMESTGKYWIPIFNILEDEINVHLTHPKYVKAIKGKKTDKKDSKWICDLFKHDLIKFSFIPPKEIRELREIARYRYKLVCMRSSERNRYQNCMTVSNVGLASVVSDPFGKTASNIMKEVMKSNVIDDDKILKLVHKNCKNKDKILDSLHGYRIESDQRFKMEKSLDHMEYLDQLIDSCEVELIKRAYPFRRSFQHITQIKGISALSAILIISEIGIDMSQFGSDKQLVSWAGLSLSLDLINSLSVGPDFLLPTTRVPARKSRSVSQKLDSISNLCLSNVLYRPSKIRHLILEESIPISRNDEVIRKQSLRSHA